MGGKMNKHNVGTGSFEMVHVLKRQLCQIQQNKTVVPMKIYVLTKQIYVFSINSIVNQPSVY